MSLQAYKEKIVRFGENRGLVGILSEPQVSDGVDRPALIMCNAGVVHRVGPNRLFVDAARQAAADGFTVLRFDLSGLGDSQARQDGLPYLESRIQEGRLAMDFLEKRGISRFAFLGLCSGADHAYRIARVDSRVVGLVMLDGYVYRTFAFVAHHYLPRVLNMKSWKNVLTGGHPFWHGLKAAIIRKLSGEERVVRFEIDQPARKEVNEGFEFLCNRGTRLFFVLTRDVSNAFNHRAQFFKIFPSLTNRDDLVYEYWPHTDHTFSFTPDRKRLMVLLRAWLRNLPASETAALKDVVG
jgi:pimeloyl-ACP methyl ester carboxylesterase